MALALVRQEASKTGCLTLVTCPSDTGTQAPSPRAVMSPPPLGWAPCSGHATADA